MAADEYVLFCGVTVGSRLTRLMEELGPSAKRYVSGDPFLTIRDVDGKKVIGRAVGGGLPVVELEDFGRNVRSILRKIFPEERLPESDVRLYVVSAVEAPVGLGEGGGDEEDEDESGVGLPDEGSLDL